MPIFKTSGIKTGELRFFEGQCPKIKPSYKIICDFLTDTVDLQQN